MTTDHTPREFAEMLHATAALDLVHAPADTVRYLSPGKASDAAAYAPGDTVVWLPSADWYNTPSWLVGDVDAEATGRVSVQWDDGSHSVEQPHDLAPVCRVSDRPEPEFDNPEDAKWHAENPYPLGSMAEGSDGGPTDY